MRALVLQHGKPTLDNRRLEPKPGPGEVVIRPTRMGICSTDLELCKGYMNFAGVLGHEFVGTVESAADAAGKPWIGKRVCGEINCVCGECDMCKAGLKEHCRDRTVLGIAGRDGCFADRFTLPVRNLHAVPGNVEDDAAVFVEPLAAAFQIVRQLAIEGRPYITVLGDGRLGLLCAQVLSKLNATVRCVGKHPRKLEHCERWGIKSRLIGDVGLRKDQDIVVDCTGSPTGLPTALQMVRPRGTIVLKTTVAPPAAGKNAGPAADGSNGATGHVYDLSQIVIDEVTVIGSRCGPFAEALDALSAGTIDVSPLITRRMKLADAEQALQAAGKSDVLKILLEP